MNSVHPTSQHVEKTTPPNDHSVADNNDESDKRLLELGYRAEFRREMSFFGVLGMSFCAIGILTGMSSAFQTGLFSGGPLGMSLLRDYFEGAFTALQVFSGVGT